MACTAMTVLGKAAVTPTALLLETSLSGVLVAYIDGLLVKSVPWLIPILAAIFADLIFGIKAAIGRGERVTKSSAIRRSLNKVFAYFSWMIFAVATSISYEADWIDGAMIAIILGNEALSAVNNHLSKKGKRVSWKSVLRLVGLKVGLPLEEIEIEDIKKEENNG